MPKLLNCKVCGCKFRAIAEKHYVARDNIETGVSTAFKSHEERLYDAFDCPECGSQIIASIRMRKSNYIPIISNKEEK